LRELPKRLVFLGGGSIGCELAKCFARFGSKITLVEMLPRLLIREDSDVSNLGVAKFQQQGIELLVAHIAKQSLNENNEKILLTEYQGQEVRIPFDQIVLALRRVANTQGYGLEELGVELSPKGTVAINDFQHTYYSNIFACGDVIGPFHFTHVAAHQAW
jgi:pyruvate/2-oxoglutarate dehydrogenase complex dihydrolipoamide dehydrogenase (E3) component